MMRWNIRSTSAASAMGSGLSRDAASQVALEEAEHLRPRVGRLLLAVALGSREVQDRVPRPLVAVELVGLAEPGHLRVDLVDVGGRRVRVLEAEEPDDRAGDLAGQL